MWQEVLAIAVRHQFASAFAGIALFVAGALIFRRVYYARGWHLSRWNMTVTNVEVERHPVGDGVNNVTIRIHGTKAFGTFIFVRRFEAIRPEDEPTRPEVGQEICVRFPGDLQHYDQLYDALDGVTPVAEGPFDHWVPDDRVEPDVSEGMGHCIC